MSVDPHTGEILDVSPDHAKRWAERARLDLEASADRGEAGLGKIRTAISQRHDVALGYRSLGDYLRTEFADALGNVCRVFGVEFRRQVVLELEQAGLSTRAIAPVVGTSHMTVQRDLDERGVTTVTPATDNLPNVAAVEEVTPSGDFPAPQPEVEKPGEAVEATPFPPPARPAVTGIDGKTYTRKAPAPVSPERQREAELDRGRSDTCRAVSDAIRSLTGGEAQARIFLQHFYPHESRFLVDGERLTRDRIQSAIEFLTAIQKEIP